ncbi:Ada DNA repair metal-binding [Penicillium atrosanguineum]|uniref:Ada DNA repair metal-binding n=2 Tax=Penicillium atrosanguineum TaxID=1132637 RepID=A0A9W9U1F8_9EURO|nr:Ada DNA repair metal-binding [Penicillium atrosanguineum]KAJ5138164.1 Ada DNA repair metal-binding [Penicillium atrosanguineum]KAJ5307114.1 Ada DNA repair metal-binding [Penicillium atrosanguineum]
MQAQASRSNSCDHFQNAHSRWRALTQRAPSSHSSFLYGVKSTMIFCRPTCTARLARRANVVFYDTAEQAQRDGFRPCKRCQPDDASFLGERQEVVTRVLALLRIQRNDSSMKRSLKELAEEAGVTPSYLCRVFKKTMGVTIGVYMKEFERTTNEIERDSSVTSSTDITYSDLRTGPLTTAETAESPSGEMAEQNLAVSAEALDLNFDFDQWFLTGGFNQEEFWSDVTINDDFMNPNILNNGVYECAVEGG